MANTHSVDLDGSTDYFTITDAAQTGLDLSGDFTFMCYVNLDVISSVVNSNFIHKRTAGQLSYEWWCFDDGGGNTIMKVGIYDGSTDKSVQATVSLTTSTTTHIAVTRSGSTVKFVIDGTQEGGDQTMSGTINNGTATIGVGATNTGTSLVNGRVDDFRVYSAAMTPAEIAAEMGTEATGSETNLEAYWKFNNDATDSTSNGNDLTANGTPSYTTPLFVDGIEVNPSAQTSTFSVPTYSVSTGNTQSPSVQTATFSIPTYSVSFSSVLSPDAQVATFSIPEYVILAGDALISPSAQVATFSVPTYSVLLSSVLSPDAQVATFSVPTYTVGVGLTYSAGVNSLLFSIPSLARVGGVWTRVARATDATWTRSSKNSS